LSQHPTAAAEAEKTAPPSASRYLDLIASKLAATEERLAQLTASDVPIIRDASEYIFSGGGKRVRPAMLLLCARLLGRNGEAEITYAAVVEMIHNATLIHDDIIDRATMRRGRATVSKVWDNSRTVLLGDWLYTRSMQMALSHDNLEVIRRLCDSIVRMTEGELMALDRLGSIDLGVHEYFEIIDRKTSRLFAAACSIPALIAPTDPKSDEALYDYGHNLGICFQLVDDLLDFTGSEADLGKPVHSDLRGGKLTLPLILALPRIDGRRRTAVEMILEDGAFARAQPEEILEIVETEGTLEEVREMASSYADRACAALEIFPPSETVDALEFAPESVLHRRS